MGKRILLHVCCGPCSTSSVERLIAEGYTPVLFFSDSNIFPYEEFRKRYDNLLIVAEHYNLDVILDDWEHDKWLKAVEGHEKDPEHGARCSICFDYNLHRAAAKAEELGIDEFTTTLTVSRFKKSESIFSEGRKYAGFKEIDFKKKDGFKLCIYDKSKEAKVNDKSYILDWMKMSQNLYRVEIRLKSQHLKEYFTGLNDFDLNQIYSHLCSQEFLSNIFLFFSTRLLRFRGPKKQVYSILDV